MRKSIPRQYRVKTNETGPGYRCHVSLDNGQTWHFYMDGTVHGIRKALKLSLGVLGLRYDDHVLEQFR